jgi:hypothetical protein
MNYYMRDWRFHIVSWNIMHRIERIKVQVRDVYVEPDIKVILNFNTFVWDEKHICKSEIYVKC